MEGEGGPTRPRARAHPSALQRQAPALAPLAALDGALTYPFEAVKIFQQVHGSGVSRGLTQANVAHGDVALLWCPMRKEFHASVTLIRALELWGAGGCTPGSTVGFQARV